MFRSVLGFAVFAVLAWLGLKLVFSVLGGLIGLAMTVLWLAAIGFIIYLVFRVVRPRTPEKIRDMIKGRPADAYRSHGRRWLGCQWTILQPLTFCSLTILAPPAPAWFT